MVALTVHTKTQAHTHVHTPHWEGIGKSTMRAFMCQDKARKLLLPPLTTTEGFLSFLKHVFLRSSLDLVMVPAWLQGSSCVQHMAIPGLFPQRPPLQLSLLQLLSPLDIQTDIISCLYYNVANYCLPGSTNLIENVYSFGS